MRPSLLLAIAASVVVPAAAAADLFQFTATLAIDLDSAPEVSFTGSGIADVNDAGLGGSLLQSLTIPAGAVAGTATVLPTALTLGGSPVSSLVIEAANGPGIFATTGTTGAPGGTMPLSGVLRACLIGGCVNAMTLPLDVIGNGPGVASTPFGGGAGFLAVPINWNPKMSSAYFVEQAVIIGTRLYVHGLSHKALSFYKHWLTEVTSSPVALDNSSAGGGGFVHGPASLTSGSTALPGATIQWVAPLLVGTTSPTLAGDFGQARFTVELVPEPGIAIALAAGAAAAGLLGYRRLRG